VTTWRFPCPTCGHPESAERFDAALALAARHLTDAHGHDPVRAEALAWLSGWTRDGQRPDPVPRDSSPCREVQDGEARGLDHARTPDTPASDLWGNESEHADRERAEVWAVLPSLGRPRMRK
jgi:hypothetical protein